MALCPFAQGHRAHGLFHPAWNPSRVVHLTFDHLVHGVGELALEGHCSGDLLIQGQAGHGAEPLASQARGTLPTSSFLKIRTFASTLNSNVSMWTN